MNYVQLTAESTLPDVSYLQPFKAVLISEQQPNQDRCRAISEWLVSSGCLYVLAWGKGSIDLYESVQAANQAAHIGEQIPDKHLIIATCHEDEQLADVLWFAKYSALHPCFPLDNVLLVHLARIYRGSELLEQYETA